MDDRQRQIREGAGLAESRLNEEFIEFLQKWSMPILVGIALIAVGYTVYGKMQKARIEKVDQAFQEFEAASGTENPNPESLLRIAEQYDGVRAVPILSRLAAADTHLRIVRSGLKPGAQLKPDATLNSPDDALTDAERELNLNQARDLYQRVLDESSKGKGEKIFAITALYGLAAVAESRKEFDVAKGAYEKIVALCADAEFAAHAKIARERIDSLAQLATPMKLYHVSDLAPLAPVEPAANPPVPLDDALKGGVPGAATPEGAPPPAAENKPAEAPKENGSAPPADGGAPTASPPAGDPAQPPATPGKPGEPK